MRAVSEQHVANKAPAHLSHCVGHVWGCPVHILIRAACTVSGYGVMSDKEDFTEGIFKSLLLLLVLMGRGAREGSGK